VPLRAGYAFLVGSRLGLVPGSYWYFLKLRISTMKPANPWVSM
jgi:hypothetical protein